MNTTLIAGQAVSALVARHSPGEIQALLRQVRSADGHAACQCRQPALRLALRERSGKLFLAAWRDEAELHEPSCPFYSERTEYRPTAAAQPADTEDQEPEAGQRQRNYAVRFTVGANGHTEFDLCDALHQLWDSSGLSRWFPGWRRDYPLARKVLLNAARQICLGSDVLAHNLYMPPLYRPEWRHDINIGWDAFLSGQSSDAQGSAAPAGRFVIGSLRYIAETQFGSEVRLHHHGAPLFMSDKVLAAVQRNNRKAWSCLVSPHLSRNEQIKAQVPLALSQNALVPHELSKVICLAKIIVSKAGFPHITRCTLLRTTGNLIPANNRWERELAECLVREDREFFRPMSHQESRAGMPSYVLKDTDPTRRVYTELFITGHDGGSPAMEERHVRELGIQAQRRHREALYWTIREQKTVPALPPATPWAPLNHA